MQKTIELGTHSGRTPEEVDAVFGRIELVNLLSKLTTPKTDAEAATRQAIDQYIALNPITKSTPVDSVGRTVKVKAMLQAAEWKEGAKAGTKTIKHEFVTGDNQKVIVYSTSKAIQAVNIGETVFLTGTVSKILRYTYRGEVEHATILKKVWVDDVS